MNTIRNNREIILIAVGYLIALGMTLSVSLSVAGKL